MIKGIGNDIIELDRIEVAIKKKGFLKKYFTDKEALLFAERKNNIGTISGNFCVKEAVSKAIGTGIRDFGLADIEVLRDDLGKPYVTLHNNAKVISDGLGIENWHVTISHSKMYATAVAIGEGK